MPKIAKSIVDSASKTPSSTDLMWVVDTLDTDVNNPDGKMKKIVASDFTGGHGQGIYIQQTVPQAQTPYIWFKTDGSGNVIDILKG